MTAKPKRIDDRPQPRTWRPTEDDYRLMKELKSKLGLEDQNILRLALRRLAEAEGLRS